MGHSNELHVFQLRKEDINNEYKKIYFSVDKIFDKPGLSILDECRIREI